MQKHNRISSKYRRRIRGETSSSQGDYKMVAPFHSMSGVGGVAPSVRTKLAWAFDGSAASSATYGANLFIGNSVKDPGQGSASTSPVNYTQFATMYNRFRVIGSTIKVVAAFQEGKSLTDTGPLQGTIVIVPSTANAAAASLQDALAAPWAKYGNFTREKPFSQTSSHTTHEVLGLKPAGVNDGTDSTVTSTTQPLMVWFWQVGFMSQNIADVNVNLRVRIVYDVEFFYRTSLSQSLFDEGMSSLALRLREDETKRSAAYKPALVEEKKDSDLAELPNLKAVEPSRSEMSLNEQYSIVRAVQTPSNWVKLSAGKLQTR